MALRIQVLSAGDARSVHTWSGIPRFMIRAMERWGAEVEQLGPVRTPLLPAGKALNRITRLLLRRRFDSVHTLALARRYARHFRGALTAGARDLLFAPAASTEIALLDVDEPLVYTSDATVALLRDYYPGAREFLARSAAAGDRIEKEAIRRSSLLLYPSEWVADSARRTYGADPTRIRVHPFGANLVEVPPSGDVIRFPNTECCRLLFIGVEWERKGGPIAVDALTRLRASGIPAELSVVGCEPPTKVRGLPGVRVRGFLDKNRSEGRAALDTLLRESDFLFLPTRAECFGIVFCEASAYGLPIVTTRTGGVSGAVRMGINGLTLPPDAGGEEYAGVIAELWEDPDGFREMSARARRLHDTTLNWDAWAGAVLPDMARLAS